MELISKIVQFFALNISQMPLPPTAVVQIRAHSPDSTDRPAKIKSTPLLILQRNAEKMRSERASVFGFGHKSFAESRKSVALSQGTKPGSNEEDTEAAEVPPNKYTYALHRNNTRIVLNDVK